ncbi:MAG TPA: hypothetical protein PL009_13605 [Flavipsychrobacter sp.]|nr:hypothetical protein [Flavipsychrobacter sp.]
MSNAANIFPNEDGRQRLSEEKLQDYLAGRLSKEEQHEIELWLADEGMESDAVEGLQKLSAAETQDAVNKLNENLRKQISGKKRKRKDYYKDNQWALIAIITVLIFAVIAYLVIQFVGKS